MASKGKGKSKLTGIDLDQQRTVIKQYEGALDISYFVQAQMKNGTWHKARIIDCRLAKDYDMKRKKKDSSYEYYVHYIEHNRRMDEWLERNRIQLTDEIVFEEPQTKKKAKKNESKQTQDHVENDEHEGMDEQSLLIHQSVTKFKTIDYIEVGKNRCETWYYSPFPLGFHKIDCLFFCDYCLAFYTSQSELKRHYIKCPLTHPPGDEIYRDDTQEISLSMFEVDGQKNQVYCENLCYLSKLFLDHKNLFWNMDPFLFFVLTENDKEGSHLVGYFSKEKESTQGWNLSCILVLPCYQRKGYGKFLITFSYELSLIEGKIGTPERPLSDLGKQAYLSWWSQRIIDYIREKPADAQFSINDIVKDTGIRDQDVIWTLEQVKMIKYSQGQVSICTETNFLNSIHKSAGRIGQPVIPDKIHFIPYKSKWEKDVTYNFPKYDPLKGM